MRTSQLLRSLRGVVCCRFWVRRTSAGPRPWADWGIPGELPHPDRPWLFLQWSHGTSPPAARRPRRPRPAPTPPHDPPDRPRCCRPAATRTCPTRWLAEAVGSYADTAPIEVAEHLSPYVMAHSPVPGRRCHADPATGTTPSPPRPSPTPPTRRPGWTGLDDLADVAHLAARRPPTPGRARRSRPRPRVRSRQRHPSGARRRPWWMTHRSPGRRGRRGPARSTRAWTRRTTPTPPDRPDPPRRRDPPWPARPG